MAKVGIGIPTYNGAEFIRECLESLQQQTFEDFEAFISDNGSTDGTSEICEEFATADRRFRHHRYDKTVPVLDNFLRARSQLESQYFMWRADDDLAEATHLAGLVQALEANPSAVLAVSSILRHSDSSEKVFGLPSNTASERVDRIHDVLIGCHPSWFYGLWDWATAGQMADFLISSYSFDWAADHVMLLPPILDEKVAFSQGGHFIQRIKRQQAYLLSPSKKLQARARYTDLARRLLDERDWTPAERRAMDRTMWKHIELRVAPLSKTKRRAVKERLLSLLRLG
ncbi:glycosyltransferase family 2 protein [Rhizobium sp. 21-4511-3d]